MKKDIKNILYLVTIVIIFFHMGKTAMAASEYYFTKDNPTTYMGEEIFVFKENVSEEDFSSSGIPDYSGVKEIIIADGVTSFDWDFLTKGFFPNAETITISKTVAEINCEGYYGYNELKKLKAVTVAEDNPNYTSDKGCLFNKKKVPFNPISGEFR